MLSGARTRDAWWMPELQREEARELLDALADLKRAAADRHKLEPQTAVYDAALVREARLSQRVRRLAGSSRDS